MIDEEVAGIAEERANQNYELIVYLADCISNYEHEHKPDTLDLLIALSVHIFYIIRMLESHDNEKICLKVEEFCTMFKALSKKIMMEH